MDNTNHELIWIRLIISLVINRMTIAQEPVERGHYSRLWLILQQTNSVCKPAMECSRIHGFISVITGLVIRNRMMESEKPSNVRRKTGYPYSGDVTWLVLYPPTPQILTTLLQKSMDQYYNKETTGKYKDTIAQFHDLDRTK